MNFLRTIFVAILCAAASESAAQEIVGRAHVNDKPIIFYEDGTWSYDTTLVTKDCQIIDDTVHFCDPQGFWRRSTGPNYGFEAIFRHNANNTVQGAIASHPFGSGVGNTYDGVFANFVKGGAETDGVPEDDVRILDRYDTTLDGLEANHFVISFPQNGLWQVNAYTVVVGDEFSVYALTWAAGNTLSDQLKSAHTSFVKSLKLNPEGSDQ